MFRELADAAGAVDPDVLAGVLCLLYDAALVGAQFDPGGPAPARSRDTARFLIASTQVAA